MATNSVLDYKWGNHLVKQEDDDYEKHVEEEEDEEEALSLCDLPVTLINDNDKDTSRKQGTKFGETEEHEEEEDDDFDFNSLGGLFSEEPEMCVADEVFFQGQILPFRHSFSSEPSLFKTKGSSQIQNDDSNKQFNHGESRSESMDNVSTSEFGSNSNSSSRSCSLRSQNSSSSTSSSTTTSIRVSKPKIRNQFHTIPSPKPQLRQSRSGTRQTVLSFNNQGGRKSSSSSTWEFFRLGVAPAPEMLGLQDLKFRNSSANNRNCVTRNSSSSSSNNSKNSSSCSTKKWSFNNGGKDGDHKGNNNHGLKQFVGKGGGLLSGCSCTVDSVVAQMDTVMIKSTNNNNNTKIKTESVEAIKTTTHAMKEKVVVAKLNKDQQKNKNKNNNKNNNAVRHKQQGKKVMMSRRRMFEWLKEVHAIRNREDEEALLSNNT